MSTFRARPCAALTLAVERGPGAEACPDEAALSARVREVRGSEADVSSTAYVVRFERSSKGLNAQIRVGETSVRSLNTQTASCEVLAKGVAVTLAMLMDSDAATEPRPAPKLPPKPEVRVAAPEVPAPRPARPRARAELHGLISLGVGGLLGVVGPVDPAFALEGGFRVGTLRLGAGALWAVPRELSIAEGSVRESLLAGSLRACSGIVGGERLNLGLCLGVFAGSLGGDAHGFAAATRHRPAWVAVPVELSLARFLVPIGWELSASALVPVLQRDFGIAGAGVAYHTPAIGGLVALRGVFSFPRREHD